MRRVQFFGILGVAMGLAAGAVSAQDFPTRPVKIVVPAAAGGPTHITAQLLADKMQVSLGQPVFSCICGTNPGT